jgi:hypothetical protein
MPKTSCMFGTSFLNHCIFWTERLWINVPIGMPHYKQHRMALEHHFMLSETVDKNSRH